MFKNRYESQISNSYFKLNYASLCSKDDEAGDQDVLIDIDIDDYVIIRRPVGGGVRAQGCWNRASKIHLA